MSWGRFSLGLGATRPLRRYQTPKPPVVVLDEDDDDAEVLIIDGAATSAYQTKKGSCSTGNVITIDDDEDVTDVAGGDKSGPSTSRAAGSPGATTPGRSSPRNRYGLDCSSDSYDSDSSKGWASDFAGSSDCEILDDASGTARKVWETAASRKKMPHGIHESNTGRDTVRTSSDDEWEVHPDENAEVRLDEDECSYYFSNLMKDTQSSKKDGCGPSSKPNGTECSNGNVSTGNETENVQSCSAKAGPAECHQNENIFQHFSDTCREDAPKRTGGAKDRYGTSSEPNAYRCSNGNISNGKEMDSRASSSFAPGMACNDKTARSHESFPEKGTEGIQSPCVDETFGCSFVSASRVFCASSSADLEDGSPPMSVGTPEKIDEKITGSAYSRTDQSPPDANITANGDMYSAQDGGSMSYQQAEVPPFSNRCDSSREFGENYPQDLDDDPKDLGHSTWVQDASDFQDGLIGEREKHKESVEYKLAAEVEWAARQRQLQIQAEEAQEAKKLRKRKKAEALRLMDMEKRQKQRLQEVRESQRKNEEDIQQKEQYRGLVRKQLEDVERRHRDMASVLRALGIPVDSEVKAAYKQALLKFHPDRVSRTDIYQQVKAEETFKFISRLKENLDRFI